jgi:glucose/sorbosone dehydrogenase
MHSKSRVVRCGRLTGEVAFLIAVAVAPATAGNLTGPLYDQGMVAVIEDVRQMPATSSGIPRARINVLREVADGSGRLFVNDLRGPLYVIVGATVLTYMDFRPLFPRLKTSPGLASGFVSFAFHPEFATNGLFYTVHTEDVGSTPPNLVPPIPTTINLHSILTEWRATDPAANSFSGSSRELMRIASPNVYHNLGQIDFNPNAGPGDADYGLLYLGSGDFGCVDSRQPEQLQRLDTVYGCVLRIDPLGGPFVRNGTNYPYGIPPANPFANDGDPSTFGEIYTYGHRNAHRLQWDTAGNETMFACDVGHGNAEEVDILVPGRNYGWPAREGTFALDPHGDLSVVYPLPPDDSTFGYTYPAAQYDHYDGDAIAGGVAYRSAAIPALMGKFVFGDIVTGDLFYSWISDLEAADDGRPATTAPVFELHLQHQGQEKTMLTIVRQALNDGSIGRTDLRLASGLDGTLYVTTKEDGFIRKLVSTRPLSVAPDAPPGRALISPNPFHSGATLRFATSRPGPLSVQIFDAGGRRVRTVAKRSHVPAGPQEVRIDRTGDDGRRLHPGVYFLRIEARDRFTRCRFVVLD